VLLNKCLVRHKWVVRNRNQISRCVGMASRARVRLPFGLFVMTAIFVGLCGGCGRSPYELAPVEGKVTVDGTPLTNARVMFAPIAAGENRNSGKPAFGTLGADGHFVLATYDENDGAVVGEHWVTLISTADTASAQPAKQPKFDRLAYPKKISVAAGQPNHVEIALTASDVARFGRLDD